MEDQTEVVGWQKGKRGGGQEGGEEGVLGCRRKGWPVFFMPFCPCPGNGG